MNFREELEKKTGQVNALIGKFLPKEEGFAGEMAKAMNYSMTAGGKRLRPLLMWESYRLFGGKGQVVAPFMVAMEMVHTHSLIHDDLPAIDNDEYRRGKKTAHAVFGEAMGILSGDALLNYAYEVAFHSFDVEPDNKNIPLALQIFASKAGLYGMLGGQSVDVANEGQSVTEEMLLYVYENKTSALIESSMMVGAILSGASDSSIRSMEKVGRNIGLAFQIQDDILDKTSTTQELGKPVLSDEKNNKTTYVTLHGIEGARRAVKQMSQEAIDLMDSLDTPNGAESGPMNEGKNEFLRELLYSLITRTK